MHSMHQYTHEVHISNVLCIFAKSIHACILKGRTKLITCHIHHNNERKLPFTYIWSCKRWHCVRDNGNITKAYPITWPLKNRGNNHFKNLMIPTSAASPSFSNEFQYVSSFSASWKKEYTYIIRTYHICTQANFRMEHPRQPGTNTTPGGEKQIGKGGFGGNGNPRPLHASPTL
jgi:hypothetical protein